MGKVLDTYHRFFVPTRRQEQAETDALQWARGTLALWDAPAFRAILARLRAMADQPIATGGDIASLSGAIGRMNGIKEVIKMIDSDLAKARRLADSATVYEDSNG